MCNIPFWSQCHVQINDLTKMLASLLSVILVLQLFQNIPSENWP